MAKTTQFKKELKELLTKYNADISFTCSSCSDTHGIYDEKMIAEVDGKRITLSHEWYIAPSDL